MWGLQLKLLDVTSDYSHALGFWEGLKKLVFLEWLLTASFSFLNYLWSNIECYHLIFLTADAEKNAIVSVIPFQVLGTAWVRQQVVFLVSLPSCCALAGEHDLFPSAMEKALQSRPLGMKLVEMLGWPEGQQKPRKVVSSKKAHSLCLGTNLVVPRSLCLAMCWHRCWQGCWWSCGINTSPIALPVTALENTRLPLPSWVNVRSCY